MTDPDPTRDIATAAIAIDLSVASPLWTELCPPAARLAEEAAHRALREALAGGAAAPVVVGVTLADDAELQRLNREYRGHDRPTNVLSFPAMAPDAAVPPGAELLLGDVVLAAETVRREAGDQGKTVADHLRHLVVHGVLHLLGHDHEAPDEAAAMEAQEIRILAILGVSDPYDDTI